VALPAVGGDHAVDVPSGNVTVSAAGKYYWVASYGGDANNEAVTGSCGDQGETSTVNPANPTIVTTATGGSLPAGSISDSANLTGVTAGAGGTITFKLYGPSATPDCSGAAIFTQAVTVNGPGNYGPVTTTVANAGSYYWIASYSGDANNNPVSGQCGDDGETSVVTKANPNISTVAEATDDTLPGTSVKDVASLTGLSANAGGTVTFKIYSDSTCSTLVTTLGPVNISAVVGGAATATSPDYTGITQAGTYWFIASYSGDGNNNAVSGDCGDDNEDVTIKKAAPQISTTATNGTLPPGTISDTANLTGVTANAGGSITFRLFGPSASPSCSGSPVFTSTPVAVSGPGSYGPVTATVTAGGSYYWIASYSGDANNNAVAGACGDAGETSVVRVLQGALNISKAVSPVAGGGTVIEFGDTLTYTLTVSATGELTQNNVVVTDFIPGYDPARPTSGKTTYVAGSAACIGGGTCTITQPGADHKITWALGDMAPGTTRQVTFKVTIDDVAGDPGETVAVDILNAGAVRSTQTPPKASNEVRTPVTKVLPVKRSKPPAVLPHTGATVQPGPLAAGAVALLGLGLLLVAAGRRRSAGDHRR
jgi:LPXTG-motif cell wall-anchored protein